MVGLIKLDDSRVWVAAGLGDRSGPRLHRELARYGREGSGYRTGPEPGTGLGVPSEGSSRRARRGLIAAD